MTTHTAPTVFVYDSWTDADLVRACELDPECKSDYVTELATRAVAREVLAGQTAKIQSDVADKIRELIGR